MQLLTDYAPPVLYLRCVGELDHHAAAAANSRIEQALDRYLPRTCAMDLSALQFMDSSGVAVILRTMKRMRELNGAFYLFHPSPQPDRVLLSSGVYRLIDVKR